MVSKILRSTVTSRRIGPTELKCYVSIEWLVAELTEHTFCVRRIRILHYVFNTRRYVYVIVSRCGCSISFFPPPKFQNKFLYFSRVIIALEVCIIHKGTLYTLYIAPYSYTYGFCSIYRIFVAYPPSVYHHKRFTK